MSNISSKCKDYLNNNLNIHDKLRLKSYNSFDGTNKRFYEIHYS